MRSIFIVFRKELLDTLRDRRTLFIMFFFPFLLIPSLLTLTTKLTTNQYEAARSQDIRVVIEDNDNGEDLVERFHRRKDLQIVEGVPPYLYRTLIRKDSLDFVIIIGKNFDQQLTDGRTGDIELLYNGTTDTVIFKRFTNTITAFEKEVLLDRLEVLGGNPQTIDPIEIESKNVFSMVENMGKLAGGILPYFFVLFCLFGAMYPAIDLFTGEKERGTLETILTVPVSRIQILTGKMAVVVLSGLFSGAVTVLGLYVALQLNPDLPEFLKSIVLHLLNPAAIALVLGLLLPLVIFFAGFLIPITTYARTFKEAQSIIQPLTIIIIVPLIIGMSPAVKFTIWTALIPVLNVALASREIIAGTISPLLYGLTFLSLIVIAAIGIWFTAQKFGDEKNILRT